MIVSGEKFQRQIWSFRPHRAGKTVLGRLRQRPTTGNSNVDVLGPNLAIWAVRRCRNSLGNTFIELVMVENPEFAVGISTLSVTVSEI